MPQLDNVKQACVPRQEVLKSDLQDTIFAANFGDVIEGAAPKVYQDAEEFFKNTHPTQNLSFIVKTTFERLASKEESSALLRLSTGFGGGKTHSLITLFHLARNISNLQVGLELLPAAGRPRKVNVVAMDARKFGHPDLISHPHDNLKIRTLWGELLYQLGGKALYEKEREVDDHEYQPDENRIRSWFGEEPALILIDELVIYMSQKKELVGATLAFITKLLSIVGARPQTALVITDPASQRAYAEEAEMLAKEYKVSMEVLVDASEKLDDMLGRTMSNIEPIGQEAPNIITRRLFEHIDQHAPHNVAAEYFAAYQRVSQEMPDVLSSEASNRSFADRIVRCYPFHPRLFDTVQDRLQAIQDFNLSRGTLRLFARILRDIWENNVPDADKLLLISAGDINWESPRIQGDLLERINRERFKAAVNADHTKHARELDEEYSSTIHRRVVSALLLESLPLTATSGLDHKEANLAVMRPSDAGSEAPEALDRLINVCWHLYPNDAHSRWQFRYEPNVNKLIEERSNDIPIEDARQRVMSWIQEFFSGRTFELIAWPTAPRQVTESARLKLVLCDSEDLARQVCEFQDASDSNAPQPRHFINAIMAVAPEPEALGEAVKMTRRLIAAEQLQQEIRDNAAAVKQLKDKLPDLQRTIRLRAIRAFNRLLIPHRKTDLLEEKILVPDQNVLGRADGQRNLKTYLDQKKLVYASDDHLDVDLFVQKILPGTVPHNQERGSYSIKAVHERVLGYRGLRLILGDELLRQTIIHCIQAGKLLLKKPDGTVYQQYDAIVGPEGNRQRRAVNVYTFQLDEQTLIAPVNAECAAKWTHVDEARAAEGGQPSRTGEPPPPPPGTVSFTRDWQKLRELAPQRGVQKLEIQLVEIRALDDIWNWVRPLNARQALVEASVSGSLRGGGQLTFVVDRVDLQSNFKTFDFIKQFQRALDQVNDLRVKVTLHFDEASCFIRENLIDDLAEQVGEQAEFTGHFLPPQN